ncbi:MAG: adenylate/guanylate cyclase domain-containing protein [Gammaproteobacteria bacterium]|nr:adenylate/guanylate cyclase domain-containing protein [Gammaproteobacteria bacterium]
MRVRYRIPITAITVFGTSSLLALSVGIVLYLGFNQAAESTRQLWADKAQTLINSMESGLEARLQPIRDQALWVARDVKDITDPAALDDYFFGVLAATPQVAGIAVISSDAKSRRWHRGEHVAIEEDWSHKPWMNDYIEQVKLAGSAVWREPIFTDTMSAATLLHDVPLYDAEGEFIGIFAQIVTVKGLSRYLAQNYSDTGITPFVLYDHDYVLAHPLIESGNLQQPLERLDELDDLVLQRIWTPDDDAAFISQALTDTEASGIFWGDDFHLFLYRDIKYYGPAPWTIGVYLNMTLQTGSQVKDMLRALVAGLVVLVLAIIASVIVGRKVSAPVKEIARAADAVDAGDLDSVEALGSSRIRELDEAGNAFNNMVKGLRERELIRETLGRFVPEKIANSLLSGGGDIPVQQAEATILFCDIEAFTRLTETLGPVKIVDVLNAYFSDMVEILERHGGVVTQFQGDAILATFNVPVADEVHAANAIRAAQEMLAAVAEDRYDGEALKVRIGINSGSIVAGAIGARGRLNYTVHGDAVNLAARLEALNKEYGTRLLVSESSATQAGDCKLKAFAEVTVRGQSQSIQLYTLESFQPDDTNE